MSDTGFFTVGGTVPFDTNLYISRDADKQLLRLCSQGTFAYVLTARQMGKSSLVVRTASRLREMGIIPLIVDFTHYGTNLTAEQWYLGILFDINQQLSLGKDLVAWWQEYKYLGYGQQLTRFFSDILLPHIDGPVVVFVDEIDLTLSLDFADDFFATIRFMYDVRAHAHIFRRISFVLVGVAMPGDLIQDPLRTPFNLGRRVELDDFTPEEALPFADGLKQLTTETHQLLRWILKWTNGHPYLTQQICRAVVEASSDTQASIEDRSANDLLRHLLRERPSWTEAALDRLVNNLLLGDQSEKNNNLLFVRDMLTKRCPEKYKYAVMFTYGQIRRGMPPVRDSAQSIAKSHLKLSGIVHAHRDVLVVRNPIYARVFDEQWAKAHLPVSWPKRLQRLAIATIAILFVASIVLATAALVQRNNALRAAQDAKIAQLRSEALFLALASQQEPNRERAVKLAVAAIKDHQGDEITVQLRPALQQALRQFVNDRVLPLLIPADAVTFALNAADAQVVTASDTGVIRISNPHTGQSIAELGKLDGVSNLVFSPDGQWVATASRTGVVQVWQVSDRASTVKLFGVGKVTSIAFSPDGQWVATASRTGVVEVWRVSDGVNIANLSGAGDIVSIALKPDTNQVLTMDSNGVLGRWDIGKDPNIKKLKDFGKIRITALSPDGNSVVIVDHENTIHVRDVVAGQDIIKPQQLGDAITNVAFTANGEQITIAHSGGTANIYTCELCAPIQDLLAMAKKYVPEELTSEEFQQALIPIRTATPVPLASETPEPSPTSTSTNTPVPIPTLAPALDTSVPIPDTPVPVPTTAVPVPTTAVPVPTTATTPMPTP